MPLDNGWYVMVTRTQDEAFDGLNRTMATLTVALGVFVVLLLGAAVLLAGSIARALGIVARAAAGLASGDLDQQVDVWSKDELGRMAGAFRDMMAYHQRMATIADQVASGDLTVDVEPQSDHDRLGIALHGMVANLRGLVESLRIRDRALAAASSPIVITESPGGPLGTIIYANPTFERLTGYAASELLGRTVDILRGSQTDALAAAWSVGRDAAQAEGTGGSWPSACAGAGRRFASHWLRAGVQRSTLSTRARRAWLRCLPNRTHRLNSRQSSMPLKEFCIGPAHQWTTGLGAVHQ